MSDKSARDVMREVLMKERMCRMVCTEVRGCDCATDVIALHAALSAAGLAIVPRMPSLSMLHEGRLVSAYAEAIWHAMLAAAKETT